MNYKKLSILLAVIALFVSTLACGSNTPAGISNIYMANDADGNNKTTTFAPTDVIFVFFDVNGVDDGAAFQIKWFALNVDGQDPNEAFLVSDYTYGGEATIYGQISNSEGGFPPAQYKVEIYLNGAKVGENLFNIQ